MDYTLKERDDATSSSTGDFAADQIPLRLSPFVFCLASHKLSLEKTTIEIMQGEMVAIVGAHMVGKTSFLQLLAGRLFLDRDEVGGLVCPSHLCRTYVQKGVQSTAESLIENLRFGIDDADTAAEGNLRRVFRICERIGLSKRLLQIIDAESQHMEKDSKSKKKDKKAQKLWENLLSHGEHTLLGIARAIIASPHLLFMDNPTMVFDNVLAVRVIDLLREFVDNRGVELDLTEVWKRRPRTLFFTTSRMRAAMMADRILHVSGRGSSGDVNIREIQRSDVSGDMFK